MTKQELIDKLVADDIDCAMNEDYGRDFLKEVFTKGVTGYKDLPVATLKHLLAEKGIE